MVDKISSWKYTEEFINESESITRARMRAGHQSWRRAPQQRGNAQGQFARLEWLAEIIVSARFQPAHARIRLRQSRKHQNRHGRINAQPCGKAQA